MTQKKLQKGSAWENADLDNNGVITDGEMAMAAKMEQLQHQREMHDNLDKMQDQQRMMAWVAMGSMVVFVVVMMTPIIDIDRVNQLSGFLNTFFVSQAADGVLQGNIDTESARIDAMLAGSSVDLDQLIELVDAYELADTNIVSSITTLQGDLATEISNREADVDAEEARATAAEAVLAGNIANEEAARIAADGTALRS